MKSSGTLSLGIWAMMALCFASCQALYIPNQPNVPLMSEGDELQVGISVGSTGYGAQLAYSPYYHWAITANGNTYSINSGGSYSTNRKFSHMYGEMGTGYYTRLSKYMRLEVLAGLGAGNSFDTTTKQLYRKIYFQPSIGYSGPIFDLGFTPRVSNVLHYKDKVNDVAVKANQIAMFFEPCLTARVGYEQLKFQVQGGLSFPMGGTTYSYRNRFFTMGFHLTFVKDFEKYK